MSLVDDIVNLEWSEFQKVQNKGGRASCQDNEKAFRIARKSQYLLWNQDLLYSYYEDLTNSIEQNRNLFTEKYARMMESTVPLEYEEFKDKLPKISKETKVLIEKIVRQRVKWAEEFLENYPKLGGASRIIHSSEDKFNQTSFETYLRAELGTYSQRTLILYYDYIKQLLKENKNLNYLEMENTIRLYKHDSLESAERSIKF